VVAEVISVRPVAGARELSRFIKFPWKIYNGDPNWVPPLLVEQRGLLDTKKNPFYEHAEIEHFLAWRGKEIVGRISAILDHHYNDFHDARTGFFGFFECVEDREVSRALFAMAERWIGDKGMTTLMGPTNPGTNHVLALLIDGFDRPPVIQMPYNPRYYLDLFADYGLAKARDLYAYWMEEITPISDKIKRVAELVRKRQNVTIRSIQMKRLKEEIQLVKEVYNDAWEKNWGFVPWTDEEIQATGQDLKMVVDADLVMLAYVGDELAGFSLSLPDINQALIRINGRLFPFGLIKLLIYSKKINQIRVLALGVKRKFQNLGLDALFYYETYTRGTAHGFRAGEFSWVLENNAPMRNAMENWGARIYKTYRMYQKPL
jgi:hypothetical protein